MGTSKKECVDPKIKQKTKKAIFVVAVGEVLNFSAYSFAPPILVTPLGALSVILG